MIENRDLIKSWKIIYMHFYSNLKLFQIKTSHHSASVRSNHENFLITLNLSLQKLWKCPGISICSCRNWRLRYIACRPHWMRALTTGAHACFTWQLLWLRARVVPTCPTSPASCSAFLVFTLRVPCKHHLLWAGYTWCISSAGLRPAPHRCTPYLSILHMDSPLSFPQSSPSRKSFLLAGHVQAVTGDWLWRPAKFLSEGDLREDLELGVWTLSLLLYPFSHGPPVHSVLKLSRGAQMLEQTVKYEVRTELQVSVSPK